MEKHEYDLKWIDPATGETQPVKSYKFDKFTGEPPSRDMTGSCIFHAKARSGGC